MATYWAVLDTNNLVTEVITGVDTQIIDGVVTADWYTNTVGATCVQTFMNNVNKTYAGIKFTYDKIAKDFVPPPYEIVTPTSE